MKYCPYCGAILPDGAPSFCPECGEPLPDGELKKTVKEEKPSQNPKDKRPKKVKETHQKGQVPHPPEDDYDGYYDDRIPMDDGQRRDGMDKSIVKKVVALVLALLVVICACLALLYVI